MQLRYHDYVNVFLPPTTEPTENMNLEILPSLLPTMETVFAATIDNSLQDIIICVIVLASFSIIMTIIYYHHHNFRPCF